MPNLNSQQLLYYAIKYAGEWLEIKKAIECDEPWKPIKYEGLYITICDKEYSDKFRELQNPPWIFFYEGNLTYLDTPCITIAGMRKADDFGIRTARELADNLKNQTFILSMSTGIQTEIFKKSNAAVMVLGSGLDVPYPYENEALIEEGKKNHLVISEYPKGAKPFAHHFPWRNRLIAALSDEVYIIETNKCSSVMLLAEEAIRLEKNVYVFPHPYNTKFQEGYEMLIKMGVKDFYNPECSMEQKLM